MKQSISSSEGRSENGGESWRNTEGERIAQGVNKFEVKGRHIKVKGQVSRSKVNALRLKVNLPLCKCFKYFAIVLSDGLILGIEPSLTSDRMVSIYVGMYGIGTGQV